MSEEEGRRREVETSQKTTQKIEDPRPTSRDDEPPATEDRRFLQRVIQPRTPATKLRPEVRRKLVLTGKKKTEDEERESKMKMQGTPGTRNSNSRKSSKRTPADDKPGQQMTTQASFTLGATPIKTKGEGRGTSGGKVKEAKRILEEKMRRERRREKLEEARNPIIATPNNKRGRGEQDIAWATPPATAEMGSPRTPARACRRTQTPIQAFLISQTLEERKRKLQEEIKLKNIAKKDMSASPNLRQTEKRSNQPARRVPAVRNTAWRKPGVVNKIASYFEHSEVAIVTDQKPVKIFSGNNNTLLPSPPPHQTGLHSPPVDRKMAVTVRGGAWPIRGQEGSHVTQNLRWKTSPPMGSELARPQENSENDGHFSPSQMTQGQPRV